MYLHYYRILPITATALILGLTSLNKSFTGSSFLFQKLIRTKFQTEFNMSSLRGGPTVKNVFADQRQI